MGTVTMTGADAGFVTTRLEDIVSWARKYSLFQYPFVTACCGMEFMSLNGPRYDGLDALTEDGRVLSIRSLLQAP